MSDLTAAQALLQADELRQEFGQHSLIADRRKVLSRGVADDDVLATLGMGSLRNVLPWQSEAPNQEAHAYATALSLPTPTVEVFVQSEQPSMHKTGEELEGFYDAVMQNILADQYDVARHMAIDPFGVRRLDEDGRFFKGVPERGEDEDPEQYNVKVDRHKQDFGLPFRLVTVDPASFYFVENQERTEVRFACEWASARESEVKEDGSYSQLGSLVVVRTPQHIWHWWVSGEIEAGQAAAGELIFEGENRFSHTGYFLYRGRYTGLPDPQRRYEPWIMSTLNVAQHLSLFVTLQAAFAVQAGVTWLEHELPRAGGGVDREISIDQKTSTTGTQVRVEGGAPAAEYEQGAHVKYRELAGDYQGIVNMLLQEYDAYRFKDVLMGEAAADASGRAIIRLQEAAGRQLAPGFRQIKLTTEEILRVIRKTIFGRQEYLAGEAGAKVYIPRFLEGNDDDEDKRRQEVVAVSQEHNIPHEIRVDVTAMSQAAQLALSEEGRLMEGILSRDTVDREFYKVKNLPLENRRRLKDRVREVVIPAAAQEGARLAMEKLSGTPIENDPMVVAPEPEGGGQNPGAISAQPTPSQPEDLGTAMSANGVMTGA